MIQENGSTAYTSIDSDQFVDSEYDDNALPAVASGLVHSVLTNVNNQIISGELKIDVVKNANSCVESVISISYSQDSFIVSVKDNSLLDMEEPVNDMDLQRTRSECILSVSEDEATLHEILNLRFPGKPLLEVETVDAAASEDLVTALMSDILIDPSTLVVTKSIIEDITEESAETKGQPSNLLSASSVSELQETIRRLEDKMKTLVEEVGNKDAMLAESERLRYYLEKDMNNMCIKMRSDKYDYDNEEKAHEKYARDHDAGKKAAHENSARQQLADEEESDRKSKLCLIL